MYGQQMNFTDWSYGYTLGPPMDQGGYQTTQHAPQPPFMGAPRGGRGGFGRGGGFGGGRGGFGRQGGFGNRGSGGDDKPAQNSSGSEAKPSTSSGEDKKEGEKKKPALEEGQIPDDKPINEILMGKNPIVFCNEQSKAKNLKMEWEQISETGPPHDKTFTWSLQMGEFTTVGVSNAKKMAKQKAAEDMARKLDAAGQIRIPNSGFVSGSNRERGPERDRKRSNDDRDRGGNSQFQMVQQSLKRARMRAQNEKAIAANREASGVAIGRIGEKGSTAKAEANATTFRTDCKSNPISKMFEHCRRNHWPEPTFEVVSENVLDQYKSVQGFTLKKTEFTMQVEVHTDTGTKKFIGNAMNKKEAKHNAAAAAWAEFGAGVSSSSISNMLQAQRKK